MPKTLKSKKDKPLTQRKSSHKGQACRRGVPVIYDQKKQSINLSLTPDAIAVLEERAGSQGCSRSETVDRWLRSTMPSPGET